MLFFDFGTYVKLIRPGGGSLFAYLHPRFLPFFIYLWQVQTAGRKETRPGVVSDGFIVDSPGLTAAQLVHTQTKIMPRLKTINNTLGKLSLSTQWTGFGSSRLVRLRAHHSC